jgi:hypothetical protein
VARRLELFLVIHDGDLGKTNQELSQIFWKYQAHLELCNYETAVQV